MARFFIDRPVFAMVIAIVIVILGAVAIPGLPISAYPQVVPPSVQVTANYLGGNAQDLEKTVAQPIEEQLVGLDGMLYYQSTSANNGQLVINITFKLGTNPDIAAVQTQNRVNVALPRLPPEVQRQGVTVKKVSTAFLMAVSLVSSDNRYDALFLTNYAQINLVNQIGSLAGVGESRLSSQQVYSMRVWLNPDKMTKLGVTATDVSNAVQAQNRQNPAGAIGQAPSPRGTDFQYAVSAPGRLTDPSQFEDIVVRAQPDASLLRIRDIGRVELGAQTYSGFSRLNGQPSANVIVYLAPGANAVQTADQVIKYVESVKASFPKGIDYVVPYNSTMFVRAAIKDVLITLMAAVGLVILVVFIFLQNWRATLIPLLTVPVAVVGTFALFPILGFSINITSMFGLVLAIGIVVDDAIVVVEAVQRHIDDGMSPHDATVQAMKEVSAPVVAIAFILAAVFIPVAFLGGISGQIYRQFAVTIAVSVLISAFNALTLSPALSAMLLRRKSEQKNFVGRLGQRFNDWFGRVTEGYGVVSHGLIRKMVFPLVLLVVVAGVDGLLGGKLPGGFVPQEDQGYCLVAFQLPNAASLQRTREVGKKVEEILAKTPGVRSYNVVNGLNLLSSNSASYSGTAFVSFKNWAERKTPEESAEGIIPHLNVALAAIPEARLISFPPPAIPGIGTAGGFDVMVQDRSGGSEQFLTENVLKMVGALGKRSEISGVLPNFAPAVPQLFV